jgi:hypothetical protein
MSTKPEDRDSAPVNLSVDAEPRECPAKVGHSYFNDITPEKDVICMSCHGSGEDVMLLRCSGCDGSGFRKNIRNQVPLVPNWVAMDIAIKAGLEFAKRKKKS